MRVCVRACACTGRTSVTCVATFTITDTLSSSPSPLMIERDRSGRETEASNCSPSVAGCAEACRKRILCWLVALINVHRLVGLVVKASASRAEDPGFDSRLRRDFFGVESHQ